MSGSETIRTAVEAMNKHDVERFGRLYAEDAVLYDPYYAEPLRGRAAIEEDMSAFLTAFPDLHNAIRSTVQGDGIAAAEFAITGVHKGPLALPGGEVAATGKTLSFDGSVFVRVNGSGQIVEERRYFDVASHLTQLGLTS